MESTGETGMIHVPLDFAKRLEGRFVFECRGPIEIRGKGRVETCFLIAKK